MYFHTVLISPSLHILALVTHMFGNVSDMFRYIFFHACYSYLKNYRFGKHAFVQFCIIFFCQVYIFHEILIQLDPYGRHKFCTVKLTSIYMLSEVAQFDSTKIRHVETKEK